jgi:hypothetical protein
VALGAAFSKGLPMIRCDHDQGVLEVALVLEVPVELGEDQIDPQDRVVVNRGVVGAKLRRILVVEVFVHVHQVHVEKPALIAVDAKELHGSEGRVLVGSPLLHRGIRQFDRGGHDLARRPGVDLEALVEAKITFDPAIAVEAGGEEAVFGQDFRGHLGVRGEDMLKARDPGAHGVEARPHGRHGTLGPGRLGKVAAEYHSVLGELIEKGRRRPLVPVGTQTIRPKGIDQDEEDIDVVALRELLDVGHGPDGSFRGRGLEGDSDGLGEIDQIDDDDQGGCSEPGPTLPQNLSDSAHRTAQTSTPIIDSAVPCSLFPALSSLVSVPRSLFALCRSREIRTLG